MKRLLLALLAAPAFAATTVTPGVWDLYKGTSKVSTHASEAACVASATAAGTYTCRTRTKVVTTDAPPPVDPPASGPTPPAGMITDKLAHPMTGVAKPAARTSYTDPQFGQVVTRITDTVAQFGSKVAKPAYGTIPAWNADESLLVLYVTQGSKTGHALFDGKTYAFLRFLDIDPADIEQFAWSSTDPDAIVYPYVHEQGATHERHLIRYQVSTGTKTIIWNHGNVAAEISFGSDPMYSSWDGDLWGFRWPGKGAFTLRLSTKQQSPFIAGNFAAQVSASGRYYVVGQNLYRSSDNTLVRKMKLNTDEHACMGKLANGQDFWAAVQFDAYEGSVVVENLDTAAVQTVVGPQTGYPYPPSGTHLSCGAFKAPGVIGVSIVGEAAGKGLLDQEILRVDLNTGVVGRVAHHRSAGAFDDYWSEPHVNISPSGKRLMYGSDWGGQSVDTYAVEVK